MSQTRTAGRARSILVPVDFSTVSGDALLFAAQLAQRSSLSLIVLHVVHEDVNGPVFYPRRNEREQVLPIDDIARNMLENFMIDMREQDPDSAVLANAGTMVVSGLPATRIPEIASLTDAALIVMGSNDRSRLSRLFSGSVSEKVIRTSHVPVTIVNFNNSSREHGSPEVPRMDGAEPFQVRTEPG